MSEKDDLDQVFRHEGLRKVPSHLRSEIMQRFVGKLPQDAKDMMDWITQTLIDRGCVFCGKHATPDNIWRDEYGELTTNWFPVLNQVTREQRMCCSECRLWLDPDMM